METKYFFKMQYGHSKLASVNVTEKGLDRLVHLVTDWCKEVGATYELVVLKPSDELYDYLTDDKLTDGKFLVW